MKIQRRKTREVRVGNLFIGGTAPVTVQSMAKTDTRDTKATIRQIRDLENAGCEIVRVAVLNIEAAGKLGEIKKNINIPLVADIHFDYRLAIEAVKQGVDKLRINPGNIGDEGHIRQVVKAAKQKQIPIRIGVNSGSLEKVFLSKYRHPTAKALTESALKEISFFEKEKFRDIVVSIKSSNVPVVIEAYNMLAEKCNYPFHIGITAAGLSYQGIVKSSIGIGSLLLKGIGDTIRVSLTSSPVEEVNLGVEILKTLELRKTGPEIIACPTCGRCEINLIELTKKVENSIQWIKTPVKIAIMGCAVNGPGEAKEADIGIAAGKGFGILFKKGKIVKKIAEKKMFSELMKELHSLTK